MPAWLTNKLQSAQKNASKLLHRVIADILRVFDLAGLLVAVYLVLHMAGFFLVHLISGIHTRGFGGEGIWLFHHLPHVLGMLWDEFIRTCKGLPQRLSQL